MKILASKREYPTFEDYVDSGLFDNEQLEVLKYAFDDNLPPKKISMLADPKFDVRQMAFLRNELYNQPISNVAPYADPEFNINQMWFWNIKYTHNISDEIVDLILDCSISDRAKHEIIYAVVAWDLTISDLREYLAQGYPNNFLEGISAWIGSNSGAIVLNLYRQYPAAFSNRQSTDIDDIARAVDELSSYEQNQLTSNVWTPDQMSILLDALCSIYFGDMTNVTLEMMLDPNLSSDEMKRILRGTI